MPGETVEAYWMPGCTSCLRMKEFLEKSGVAFTAINANDDPAVLEKLERQGLLLPATCIGDRCASGLDLSAVAELIGVTYEPRPMLPPAALVERWERNQLAGCRYIAQMPADLLRSSLEGRDRPM